MLTMNEVTKPITEENNHAPAPRDAWTFPTSFAQRRLWFIDQVEPGNALYNVPAAYRIRGRLDPAILQSAFASVIARHEILRTTFRAVGGEPMQIVAPTSDFHLPVIEISNPKSDVLRIIREESERPFHLDRGPLLRAVLLDLPPSEQVLILSLHHIITDAWSQDILMRELTTAYDALKNGGTPQFPELPIQYADFAAWQREAMQGETLEKELAYWRERLKGLAPLDLPHLPRHPSAHAPEGATFLFELPEPLTAAIRSMAQRESATLFVAMLAGWQALLARYTGQTDIAVGSPISDRSRTETEGLIGFFLNTLVLRTQLAGNPTVRELLHRVRDTTLDAFAHQDLPFEMLVEDLQPARQPGRNPLLNAIFVLVGGEEKTWRTADTEIEPLPVEESKAKFDLLLHLRDTGRTIKAALVCDKSLFTPAMIRRIASHYETLLAGIASSPGSRLNSLPLMPTAERERILHTWNNTATPFPADRPVHDLFHEQARLNPKAVAIEDGEKQLTYAELDRLSDNVAATLVRDGILPGDAVAISLPRSAELIAGILGILKAGAAYVPLDISYPRSRHELMLRESRAKLLVDIADCRLRIADSPESPIPGFQSASRNPQSAIAYIMFTSGSTGVPKAVSVLHRGITRLVINTNYIAFTPADVVAHTSNTSFDPFTLEIWGALLHGARLVVVPKEILLSPQDFVSFIRDRKITILITTTPLFHHFAREIPGGFGTLRYVVVGGDSLQPEAVRAVLQTARPAHLINAYGPTEATTIAICHDVTEVAPDATSVPIGRPISNTTAYILDSTLEPVPPGVTGELYLGGPGIAAGYLNNPEATAASFLPDPFAAQDSPARPALLYKTGDLARWREEEGVKISGFRIEPGEIEAVLMRHAGVRQAIVAPRADSTGQKQLAAYIVPQPGAAPLPADLREHLLGLLPKHMVPTAFAFLDTVPFNANGKVDAAALSALPVVVVERVHEEAATWMEALLVQIWEDILAHRPIGVTEDFFDMGGHSLLAIRMLAEIEKLTGVRIPPDVLFQEPTIRRIAAVLTEKKAAQKPSPVVKVQPGGAKPPLFFFHGDFLFGGLYLAGLARLWPRDRPCYAIEPHGFDGANPPPTIEEMAVARLKLIQEIQPKGPYFLGGFCNGGLVAFQVARLLRAQGQEVACLVLLAANGMNSRFHNLKKISTLAAHIRGLDAEGSRRLFLKWRKHFLFAELLARHHLKELEGRVGAPLPRLIWAKTIRLTRWLLRSAGLRTAPGTPSDGDDGPPMANMEAQDRRIWDIYSDAVNTFIPARYDGKVYLLRETDLPPELAWMDSDLGWSKVVRSLAIHNIPGGHYTITAHSNIVIFAEQLKVCLEQAEAEQQG